MKNLDKKNGPTKNETYTSADEQECNIAQPVVPRPVGVARPVQFPHRESAIPKVREILFYHFLIQEVEPLMQTVVMEIDDKT